MILTNLKMLILKIIVRIMQIRKKLHLIIEYLQEFIEKKIKNLIMMFR